jgi:ribonuclease P protein component
MERLLRRSEFLAAAKAPSAAATAVVVQVRPRDDGKAFRVGYTCTKKLGNAVKRNRIRRRMREAAKQVLPAIAKSQTDYVLIGRMGAENRPFEDLRKDIISAVTRVHSGEGQKPFRRQKDKPKP